MPVPKVACPVTNGDYRPVALTSIIMKCFEKIVVSSLKSEVDSCLDPLQFAYRQGRSTEDAAITVTHLINKHLEHPQAYARVLFADFSSAFDTIQPNVVIQKLIKLNVNPVTVKWFYSFLTNRSQQVLVNGSLSTPKQRNTGVPQGCVSSPILFTLYTNECKSTQPCNHIIKFSDDTIILSLLDTKADPSVYFREIDTFKSWCDDHYLLLNTKKTKEMIFDPRGVRTHNPVTINNTPIEQVSSYKYLGLMVSNNLSWSEHVDYLCSRLAQRLHFLRRLRLFGVRAEIRAIFYSAVFASVVRYGMAVWYGSLTVQSKTKLHRMVTTALKLVEKSDSQPLQLLYEEVVVRQASKISADPSHILFSEYDLLPSGRRYRASKCKYNRFKLSFVPTSISLLNKQISSARSSSTPRLG